MHCELVALPPGLAQWVQEGCAMALLTRRSIIESRRSNIVVILLRSVHGNTACINDKHASPLS